MPERYFFFLPALAERVFGGTVAPLLRASLKPIAIACLRLFTFLPEPERSVPFFFRRIALATVSDAFFE